MTLLFDGNDCILPDYDNKGKETLYFYIKRNL